MSLQPGARLSAYEILGLIGTGGMGEVYRARDTKLDRDVALKVLPEIFTSDPDRLARFEREAKVLASLNHPNIAAIYGLEEADGVRALVLELVEGPTLEERLRAHGSGLMDESLSQAMPSALSRKPGTARTRALPLDEALSIARQIAEALEAAHEHAIIHRDLKPANIKLRPDGVVKVLDFGLAKALADDAGLDPSNSPTISLAATRAGVILGTAAYMAPEQAKGRTADKRSDVWAFGCVLYEMLTGTRAFAGEDVSDTLAAVLRGEPEWGALPEYTPAAVRTVLQRCLQKDAKQRVRDIGDVRLALGGAFESPATPSPQAQPLPPSRLRLVTIALSIVAASVVTAIAGWTVMRLTARAPQLARFAIVTPPAQPLSTVFQDDRNITISPDGTHIVYTAGTDRWQLVVRALDQLDAQPLTSSVGARQVFHCGIPVPAGC